MGRTGCHVRASACSWSGCARRSTYRRVVVSAEPDPAWTTPSLCRAIEALDGVEARRWLWWTMPAPRLRVPSLANLLDDVPEGAWLPEASVSRFRALLLPEHGLRVDALLKSSQRHLGFTVESTDPEQPEDGWDYEGKRMKRRIAAFRPDVAFTVLASASGSSRQRLVEIHRGQIRLRDLTPVEVARLMGLPSPRIMASGEVRLPRDGGYLVPGTIGQAVRALGDAVCVPAVAHLARHLLVPLADARARVNVSAPGKAWRPIKAATTGIVTYLPPASHAELKAAAGGRGISMQAACLEALGHWIAANPPQLTSSSTDRRKRSNGEQPCREMPDRRKGSRSAASRPCCPRASPAKAVSNGKGETRSKKESTARKRRAARGGASV